MRKVVIVGSSRRDGDTRALADRLAKLMPLDIIDLNDYNFTYYDYEGRNRNDDYLRLIRRLVDEYDVFIFATPVYYYAMSGIMKVFFDRFSDLITIAKYLGERLKGKKMAAISTSFGDHLGENFWLPFSATARFLGMEYLTHLHTIPGKIDTDELSDFLSKIDKGAK